jgi:hypothetical protein
MTTDVASALEAKSDQLNADDLLGGPIIIEITKVTNLGKGKEQPLVIGYKGDDGKPWKPCKSMGRVMSQAWETTDGSKWIGRRVKLFRDPNVTFGAQKPGGIRISHLSHINETIELSITRTKGKKANYSVEPLVGQHQPKQADNPEELKKAGKIEAVKGIAALKAWWKVIGGVNQNTLGAAFLDELKVIANNVGKPAEEPANDYPDAPPQD